MIDVYAREPIRYRGTIPIFSISNDYTNNYEKISADHLASIQCGGMNPFIPENLWVQYENSTVELVRKYSKPGDMILDVGVGLGRLLSNFPELQRYGMDISFGYLNLAQTKGIEVCYALAEEIPYKEEIFDIVTCTDILEHVLDLNVSISKILSVLKNNGVLIARVPYREDLSQYLSSEYPYKYAHIRNFDENSLCLLFERVFGCEVMETTKAGYNAVYINRLKSTPFIPKRFRYHLPKLFLKVKAVSKPLYESLLKRFYDSFEINIVIKKKQSLNWSFVRVPITNNFCT